MIGIMVRERRMSRLLGVGGRGMPPPSTSTPEGSTPRGEGKTTEQDKVAVGNVMGMMRYFHRMSEALINHLYDDEGREYVPNEGSQRPFVVSRSVHREHEKVKFPKFMGFMDSLFLEYWLENMAMCFALRDYCRF
jgi:hypothetical protein